MSNLDSFSGLWTYRSFLRDPNLDTEYNSLKFGAGNLSLSEGRQGLLSGSLGGEGWSLSLKGRWSTGNPNEIRFQGKGIISNEEWIYDYLGYLAPHWPNGIDERPSIIGTIVRTVPHSSGSSSAGFVASWIAVKK